MATADSWYEKDKAFWASTQGEAGKRWARPEEPILHTLDDERAEAHILFHNINYRTSRKYINAEKVKILKAEVLACSRSNGHARYHKCNEIFARFQAACRVASNVDRGPLARKRDVGLIYQTNQLAKLQKAAAELELENPFPPVIPYPNKPHH